MCQFKAETRSSRSLSSYYLALYLFCASGFALSGALLIPYIVPLFLSLNMFTPTKALQALKRILWRYPTHHATDGRRPEAEAVVKHYDFEKLETRGVEEAHIKLVNYYTSSLPHTHYWSRSPFHGGDGQKKEHLTVEFKDKDGIHVTTHHVPGPRDNK